jgi:hypothetical protein
VAEELRASIVPDAVVLSIALVIAALSAVVALT